MKKPDDIQNAVIARALELKLTAAEIAELCGGHPNADHVHRYLTYRASMGSHALAKLFAALGLKPCKGENDDVIHDLRISRR